MLITYCRRQYILLWAESVSFYRSDALLATQPTVSKHWRQNATYYAGNIVLCIRAVVKATTCIENPCMGKIMGGGNSWKLKFAEFSLLSAFLIASWLHWIDLKHTNCWLAVHHVFNVTLLCKLNLIQKLLESGLTCPELLYSMYMYLQPKLPNLRTNAKRQ